MSTRKQRNNKVTSADKQNTLKFVAKMILLVLFYSTLFLFIGLMVMSKAKTQVITKVEQSPVVTKIEKETKEAEYAIKMDKLISKAIHDKTAILVQCYNKKCHDTANGTIVNVPGKDGYFLIYTSETDSQKERIKQVAEDVKKLSTLVH